MRGRGTNRVIEPVPIDEYRALAVKLAAIHDELVRLDVHVSNRLAKKRATRWRNAMASVRTKLVTARFRLEDLACAEHGTDNGMRACYVAQPRAAIHYEEHPNTIADEPVEIDLRKMLDLG